MTDRDLEGLNILVVGGAGGIGAGCVDLCTERGATVAIADLPTSLAASADRIRGLGGGKATTHAVDVANPSACDALVDAAVEAHGKVDGLVMAAGRILVEPAVTTSAEAWASVMAINASAPFFLSRALGRHLIDRGAPGSIVLIGSIIARVARLNNVAYCSSKAAVVQTARCLALEWAADAIRVNVVSPGSTATQMLLGEQTSGDVQAVKAIVEGDTASWRVGIPLGHMADPLDQAHAAAFLLSDAARHITGQELCVDGGQSLV